MSRDADLERAAQMRAAVDARIPEARAVIRDLLQAGLIAGWRNVSYVGDERIVPGSVNAIEFLENSKAARVYGHPAND